MGRRNKPAASLWLIDQRKRRGWRPEDVAARADVSATTVRGWESGRSIGGDALIRLEAIFGVPAPNGESATGPQGDVAAAVREQTQAIRENTAMLADLLSRLAPVPPPETMLAMEAFAAEHGYQLVPAVAPSGPGGTTPPLPAQPARSSGDLPDRATPAGRAG